MFNEESVFTATFRSTKNGAANVINCAVNPDLNTQQSFFYEDCRPSNPAPLARYVIAPLQVRIAGESIGSFALLRDEAAQEQLWEISINIVKNYLSPDVFDKYGQASGPSQLPQQTAVLSELPEQPCESAEVVCD